ncbi:MAG: hypothetical protein GY869_11165 [Planctomycetes bacterium]|nr:hypothetical protein [Planctomycetota bacterium]
MANLGIANDRGSEQFSQESIKVALATEFKGENQFSQYLLIWADTGDSGDSGAGVLAAVASIFDQGVGSGIMTAHQAVITRGSFPNLPPAFRAEDLDGGINFIVTGGTLRRAYKFEDIMGEASRRQPYFFQRSHYYIRIYRSHVHDLIIIVFFGFDVKQ